MKAYPAYKESGVDSIGHIPSEWGVFKLKRATQFVYGNSLSKDNRIEGETPVFGSNGIVDYHSDAITQAPCIIVGRKGSFGKVNYSEIPCFPIDTTYFVDETATRNNIRWLYYLLLSLKLDAFSKDSAVPGLSREDAYERRVVIPSLPEQKAIADFLDRKTAQIDTLIEKKQRQIALLEEQRTALINQAVTKGLDPSVPLKDSGIEWLGEIPRGWEVVRLKYLANIKTGERDTVDNVEDGDYPFFVRSQTVERINSYSFDGEAVLTAGDGVGVAKVFHYINGKFDYHQRVYKFSDFQDVSGRYFFYFVRNFLGYEVLKLSAKSTVDSLRLPMLQNFPVPIPSVEEQEVIVNYLDQKEIVFAEGTSKLSKQIELLQEYRTALISAAVTGKIDVRTQL